MGKIADFGLQIADLSIIGRQRAAAEVRDQRTAGRRQKKLLGTRHKKRSQNSESRIQERKQK
jgi:hypothetical protein